MSIQAVSWALGQWIDAPGAKLVLVALANYADHRTGEGFPPLDDLVGDTCMSRRTIQRHIGLLVDLGLVVKQERHAEGGRQTTNIYRLDTSVTLARPAEDGPDAVDNDAGEAGGGCQNDTLGGVTADMGEGVTADTLTTLNRQNKPSQEPLPLKSPQGEKETRSRSEVVTESPEDGREAFDRFFEIWTSADPRLALDPKSRAWGAWRRLTAAERSAAARPEAVQAVVTEQRRARRTMLKSAATYLGEKLWTRVAAAPSGTDPLIPITIYSRPWWWLYWRRLAKGGPQAVAGMLKLAADGYGTTVPQSEASEVDAAAGGMVAVLVQSDEYRAWAAWCEARRWRLPKPDRAERVFLPSLNPPGV